ncbi:MAG: hypothetical protein JST89_13045 [Cyanobacteria bacterium SZAS-4]|nr:hypothetical protein [Cyanobacteria bacterium SZAS-4]
MGIETPDVAQPAAEKHNGLLNLLSVRGTHEHSKQEHSSGATVPKAPDAEIKSNFAGLPEVSSKTRTLDLNTPLYPNEKRPNSGNDSTLLPANKYEKIVSESVKDLSTEANFTAYTQAALQRDTDRFPAVRNEKDQTTTYTIEQIGLTDRNLKPEDKNAEHFKRLVNITVPDGATSLKDCKFDYKDRQIIDVKEFDALVDHAQKRQSDLSARAPEDAHLVGPKDMSFYTHGIRTGAEEADFTALALQLTNGHSVINVDWKSTAIPEETYGLTKAYELNTKGAAESYPKFEKQLDLAINHIGADRTDMIAFSHGAAFDSKYLQHRRDTNAPKLDEIVFSHPDVKCSTMKPVDSSGQLAEADRFYSSIAKSAFVIGGTNDLAMTGAAWNECESAPKGTSWLENHNKQMALHARLGNGGEISRTLVAGHGGTYVTEPIIKEKAKNSNHFVNMVGISSLLNNPGKIATKANTKDCATKIATLER